MLAPIALYPEPVLAQVLTASTNAQEVLDAGNWLIDNESLKGDALTKAAADEGFSPTVQALVHFPTVVDMMCRELDWTKQVGDAFTADQAAVLASVQRLRAQAAEVGNLKSSPEMTVEKTKQNDKTSSTSRTRRSAGRLCAAVQPDDGLYRAAGDHDDHDDDGLGHHDHRSGDRRPARVRRRHPRCANVFDDDDDHDDYGYPNWGYGGVYYGGRPYYPHNTFVYAPRDAGYRPTPYYRPPANYQNRYNNNYNEQQRNRTSTSTRTTTTINRFDKNQNRLPTYNARSPVASATRAATTAVRRLTTVRTDRVPTTREHAASAPMQQQRTGRRRAPGRTRPAAPIKAREPGRSARA